MTVGRTGEGNLLVEGQGCNLAHPAPSHTSQLVALLPSSVQWPLLSTSSELSYLLSPTRPPRIIRRSIPHFGLRVRVTLITHTRPLVSLRPRPYTASAAVAGQPRPPHARGERQGLRLTLIEFLATRITLLPMFCIFDNRLNRLGGQSEVVGWVGGWRLRILGCGGGPELALASSQPKATSPSPSSAAPNRLRSTQRTRISSPSHRLHNSDWLM